MSNTKAGEGSARTGGWGALLAGAAGGALATVLLGIAAVQGGWADQLVRKALVDNPTILVETADALRDNQYAPVLAANRQAIEAPFGSGWKGPRKATSPWSSSTITPAATARRRCR